MSTKPKTYATEVRGQYEELPYPARDIADERKKTHALDGLALSAFNHFGWAGKRDLHEGARILVAGTGTGDDIVIFAEQLRGKGSEIVGLDISSASLEVTKARLAERGLINVTLHHMSLLDLPQANLGTFDIIDCGGVLHHLPDPDAGLAALASVLKDDGIMAIMVYGQYGRLAIYMVQTLMRHLTDEDMTRSEKIEIAREFLQYVPERHWLLSNSNSVRDDLNWPDGSGLYDLFLHSIDRAYTVPEIYAWLDHVELELISFFSEFTDDCLYKPEEYTPSALLRERFSHKTLRERQAIAELINSTMRKHYFYVAKEKKNPAAFADDMIITYGFLQQMFVPEVTPLLLQALQKTVLGQRIQGMSRPFPGSPPLLVTKTAYAEVLLPLIDGTRTIGAIIKKVAGNDAKVAMAVRKDLELLYKELRSRQMVFLRHETIPDSIGCPEMLKRLHSIPPIR